jgi:hypothetical protein
MNFPVGRRIAGEGSRHFGNIHTQPRRHSRLDLYRAAEKATTMVPGASLHQERDIDEKPNNSGA